jgi:hypothetical protein
MTLTPQPDSAGLNHISVISLLYVDALTGCATAVMKATTATLAALRTRMNRS